MSAPFPLSAIETAAPIVEQQVSDWRAAEAAEDGRIMAVLAGASRRSPDPVTDGRPHNAALNLVDWAALFSKDHKSEDWLVEPVLAKQRGHALVAGPKVGKSLLMMNLAMKAALGRNPYTDEEIPPVRVLYLDYEQTEADLSERFTDMGCTAADVDLLQRNFHYALLPAVGPLDTERGADQFFAAIAGLDLDLVVIDTLSRAVEGNENDSSTVQAMYRLVCSELKRHGVAYVRLDHLGHDKSKDARGSSAKNDDVDIVWKLERANAGYKLKATHRRVGWCPEYVNLTERSDVIGWTVERFGYPEGVKEVADTPDRLGVSIDVTVTAAMSALSAELGKGRRKNVVSAAVKYHKNQDPFSLVPRSGTVREPPEPTDGNQQREPSGTANRRPVETLEISRRIEREP